MRAMHVIGIGLITLMGLIGVAGCAGIGGGPKPAKPVDALDVSKLDWRFARAPVDDVLRNPRYAGGNLQWDLAKPLAWPDRGPDHKMIQSALVALFVRNGAVTRCVVDSVPKGRTFKSLENIDPGHRCDVQPRAGETIFWCLCSEEGPDRRTNIVKAGPYP